MDTLLPDVRLLGHEPVREVVDLSTGRHNVLQVNGRYVVKICDDRSSLEREAVGLYLFGRYTSAVPRLVTQGDAFLVAECFTDCVTASVAIECGMLKVDQVSSFVASMMATVYWKFQSEANPLRLYSFLGWPSRINAIVAQFSQNRMVLEPLLGKRTFARIDRITGQIAANASLGHRTSLLHRDIHLDNILVSLSGGYPAMLLIDMEHCLEGPIELELQNARFWDDDKSVDVEAVRSRLVNDFRVPYQVGIEKLLLNVYIADQCNIAIRQRDAEKLNVVVGRVMTLLS